MVALFHRTLCPKLLPLLIIIYQMACALFLLRQEIIICCLYDDCFPTVSSLGEGLGHFRPQHDYMRRDLIGDDSSGLDT